MCLSTRRPKKKKQEDLLDLITALLKFNCSLSTTVAAQCSFQSIVFDDLSITVGTTSLDQHKLFRAIT